MTVTECLTQAAQSRSTSAVAFMPAYVPWSAGYGEDVSVWDPLQNMASLHGFVNWAAGMEKGSWQMTVMTLAKKRDAFAPRTALGAQLLSIRNRAITSGMKLLSEEEVLEEVRRRRGELENGEADIY
jgi:hypothetical protein